MFSLNNHESMLDESEQGFIENTYAWLLRNFGGDYFYKDTELVLPTDDFFPGKPSCRYDQAELTFLAIKKHMAIEEWPCKLIAIEDEVLTAVHSSLAISNPPSAPLGQFEVDDDENVNIYYNPSLINSPTQLVATLVHELSHYVTSTVAEDPPGGWEYWEFATDVSATFFGFGIFMGNSASSFQQFSDFDRNGWKSERSGYLSEVQHMYSLGLFMRLKGLDVESVYDYLKPELVKTLKRIFIKIDKSHVISELKEIIYSPYPKGKE